MVLLIPLIGYLKRNFPATKIDLLCRAYAAPIARLCEHIDQVHVLEEIGDEETFFRQGLWASVVFAHPVQRLAMAAWRAGVPNRVGTINRLYNWFSCNRRVYFRRVHSRLHEAQLNFLLMRPLGLDVMPSLAQLVDCFGLHANPDKTTTVFKEPGRFHVILHPGSNGNGREWPISHYLKLAQLLREQSNITFLITGSGGEGARLQQHAPELLNQPNVRNLCGTLDLDQLATLIAQSDGLIASGTGPLHMAAALGRPTLGLFPALKAIDAIRWGALGRHARNLSATRTCDACTDRNNCRCMQEISPEQVQAVVIQWCTTPCTFSN